MLKIASVGTLLLCGIALSGCDSDSPVAPMQPTTTTTTAVSMSEIDLTIDAFGAFAGGQGNAFFVDITLTESAGLGANINFARLEVYRATGELEERRELGANAIIAGVGDNRLEASSTESAGIVFTFRATVKSGRQLVFTMGFTDDAGNDIELSESFTLN